MRFLLRTSCFLLITIFKQLYAQTILPLNIKTNQIWHKSGNPYIVNVNTYAVPGVSIKIMPGVRIVGINSVTLSFGGQIQFLGKKDTPILVSNLSVAYAGDNYNAKKGTGSTILYAVFDSISNLSFNSAVYSKNLVFNGGNINIRPVNDSIFSIFDSCVFNGNDIRYYGNRDYDLIKFNNCNFNNLKFLLCNGNSSFKSNYFNSCDYLSFTAYGNTEFLCNRFYNSKYTTTFDISKISYKWTTGKFYFESNTIDSGVVEFSGLNKKTKYSFRYNNFLSLNQSNPLYFSRIQDSLFTIDMKENFWKDTSALKIANLVLDNTDDIRYNYIVNYSNYLLSKNITCQISNNNSATKSLYSKKVIVEIQPNPTSKWIGFTIKNIKNLKIFDCAGKLTMSFIGKGSNDVYDVSNLKNGIYFISIITESDDFYSTKFIKQ